MVKCRILYAAFGAHKPYTRPTCYCAARHPLLITGI